MLTRSRLLSVEGELEEFDSEIGKRKASRKPSMEDPVVGDPKGEDEQFKLMFFNMQRMLEELYNEKKKRDETSSSKDPRDSKERKGKGVDHGEEPPEPPSSPSSSSTLFSYESNFECESSKKHFKSLLLKLDVKFELPMYDGELNPKKLENWIKQLEVYCRIQNIVDDSDKIQLATLRLGGITLIWWESKTQSNLRKKDKIISSWSKFTKALRK